MRIVVYEGTERVEYVSLPGDIEDYDVIIESTSEMANLPEVGRDDDSPEIPQITLDEIEKKTNKDTYKRMRDKPASQPAKIRRYIYESQVLTRRKLNEWAKTEGYRSNSSGIQASLIVLENITEEVIRKGEDKEQMIIWTGEI